MLLNKIGEGSVSNLKILNMKNITTDILKREIGKLKDEISALKKENIALENINKKKKNQSNKNNVELNRFKVTLNALDSVVYVSDLDTYELLFLNKKGESLIGNKIRGKCFHALQLDQDEPCEFCTNNLLLDVNGNPKEPYVWEFQNTITKQWYHISDQAINWPDGRIVRLEIATDITNRKHTEIALQKSEKLVNLMVNSSPNEFMLLDPNGVISYASKGAAKIFGISAEKLVGRNPFDYMNVEDKERRWSYVNRAVTTRNVICIDHEFKGLVYESYIQAIFDVDDTLEYLAVYTLDITERIAAKRKIQLSQKRYQDLYDLAQDMYFSVGIHGIVLSVNQFGADSLGYKKNELIGQEVWKVVYEKDLSFVKKQIEELINNERGYSELEFRKIHKDGSILFVQEKLQFVAAKHGNEAEIRIICRDVTKSKATAIALNESENRYQEIFKNSFSIMMQIDPANGKIIDVNKAAIDYYGYSLKQFTHMNIKQINALSSDGTQTELKNAKKGNRNHFIFKHKLANGSLRNVEVFSSEILIDKKVTLFSIIHDINDRMIAEQALLESEERYRIISEQKGQLVYDLNVRTDKIQWYGDAEGVSGYSLKEFQKWDLVKWGESIHPEDRDDALVKFEQALETGESYEAEYRFLWKNKSYHHIEDFGSFIRNSEGEVYKMVGIMKDVTFRKEAEQALKESEEKYRLFFENNDAIIFFLNPENQEIIFANNAALKFYGYAKDEFLGMNVSSINLLSTTDIKYKIAQSKKNKHNYFIFKHKLANGEIRDVEVYQSKLKINNMDIFSIIVHDITDRIKAEHLILDSEEKLRSIFNSIDDIVFVLDIENRFISVNVEKHGLLLSPKNFIGEKLEDVMPLYVHKLFKTAMLEVKQGKTQEFDYQLEIPDGTHWFSVKISPILSQKKFSGSVAVVRDISESKMSEIELRKYSIQLKERNEELDAFSHTVAHDLKNPIGVVLGFANVIAESFSELSKEEILMYLGMITKSGLKSQQIIDSLLLFANVRKAEVKAEEIEMESVIDESLRRLSFILSDSKTNIIKPSNWPQSMGYSGWIEEVWTNYISNAIKYGGEQTELELGVDAKTKDGMIRFWVKDNGKGISEADQVLLFKKFERLDQTATDGHGLGLSIVRRIIEKLGGQVGVESEVGKGSLFYFTLPSLSK